MPRLRLLSLFAIAAALLLAACGSSHSTTSSGAATVARQCPPGSSQMGCAIVHPAPRLSPLAAPAGAKFPDVSSWQGHPNWAAAKPHISMAAVKAGEFVEDPDFAWNVGQLKALGIKWTPYWFVRPTGCVGEANQYVSVIRSVGGLGVLPPVLDIEVPGIANYAGCMAPIIHDALGRWPIIYTSPGTWPGGSSAGLLVWGAAYGPVKPCLWTCSLIAWQYTDGRFGAATFIPGIGLGDVSVDLGFSKLTPPLPPAVNHHYGRFSAGGFPSRWGVLHERAVVQAHDRLRPGPALNRLRAELSFLAARDYVIAHRQQVHGHPSWGLYWRGWRFQQLAARSHGRG